MENRGETKKLLNVDDKPALVSNRRGMSFYFSDGSSPICQIRWVLLSFLDCIASIAFPFGHTWPKKWLSGIFNIT